jgi:RNA polymerase sigma factor (sigma-70 family)
MSEQPLTPILRHLRQHIAGTGLHELTDRQLLERFAHHRDETAFAALVQRHGPMVRLACRRVLGRPEDAEDAFQAAFMVLARKAASVAWRESVGGWLYQTAHRVAAEARSRNARRDALDKRAARERQPASTNQESLLEVCDVLHESLEELPARYREPLALCYLHGLTRDQAAQTLGWSLRTLDRRLAQGRERLRRVLTRRGVTLPAAFLAGALSSTAAEAAVSASLMAATMRAAVSFAARDVELRAAVPAAAAALANSVLCTTASIWPRVVALLALVLLLAVGTLGAFVGVPGTAGPARVSREDSAEVREPAGIPKEDEKPPARKDRLGDPLPPGAVARMGSSRLRHLTHMANLGAVVSPDSKTLITTSEDGVRAWSMTTGKLLYQFRDDFDFHPVFSPNGKRLAMIGNSAIYLRDPATGRKLQRIPATGEFPTRPGLLAYSADGRRLAVALDKGDIVILDPATGKPTISLDVRLAGKIRDDYFLVFSADGRTLLSMGRAPDSRDTICHWDIATGKLLKRVVPDYAGFRPTVTLSPDGRLVAVPTRGPVTLFDTQTGKIHCTLQGERNRATYGLAFSPDSKTLATASSERGEADATASLWDTATGKLRRRFRVPMAAMTHLQFSSDGRLLLIPGGCLVRLWDIATGNEILDQPAHTYGVRSLAFTPDGRSIVSGGGETIRVWDATTGEQRQVINAHRWHVNRLVVRPDGRNVVSCGADGTVRVHDLTSGKELRRCLVDRQPEALQELGPQILRLALAPDGRRATTFCGQFDKTPAQVHVWDLETGRAVLCRPSNDQGYSGVFSPDGRFFFTPRQHYDPSDGKAAKMAGAPKDGQRKKAPLEKAGASDGPPRTTIVVREVATDREVLALPQPDVFGYVMALTPDGQCLLTTTHTHPPDNRADNQGPSILRLWELVSGKERLAITSARKDHYNGFSRFAVARDGRTLATVRTDKTIQLWDLATGKEILRLPGHDAPADSLAFSPDGKRLATGHRDSTILVWDIAGAYKWRPVPRPAEARELETWWRQLTGEAPEAHRAIWALAGVPAQAVPLLRDRLRSAAGLPSKDLKRLVQELDSSEFAHREEASRRLGEFGEDAELALREALAHKPSAEVRRRIERLLAGPRLVRSPEVLRSLRAVQVLEAIGDHAARKLLDKLAGGAPEWRLTREARAALDRLSRR